MDAGAYNVVYLDRRAKDDYARQDSQSAALVTRPATGNPAHNSFSAGRVALQEVAANVETVLSTFAEVFVCGSGRTCLDSIIQILDSPKGTLPTFVIIDVSHDDEQRRKRMSREPRTPSPTSSRIIRIETGEPDDLYGLQLLIHICSEISSRNFPKLVIPVVMLTGLDHDALSPAFPPAPQSPQLHNEAIRYSRFLDAGAVDVFCSPLSKERMHSLAIHAYRVQKELAREEAGFLTAKRNRKLSWVGVNDAKPYAYLREAMVSNLMTGICNPESVGESLEPTEIDVDPDRKTFIETVVGTWAFSAHDLNDDELLYGALIMLKHALQMPELDKWRLSEANLILFLVASRTAYNDFVKYHNFRHVVDVLQALFHFLVRIGTLPPYPPNEPVNASISKSPIATLLQPFDALTLLISAIGHDVGHPGVNNAFLVALNAPLAQLYNDRSVLESFHCAAYSQILRRWWPQAFADTAMRKLMINNILATDMGLHFKYMSDLGNLQQKIAHDKGALDAWSVKVKEEQKDLTCGLLIKCADICNVARKFDTAAKWADILTDEFSNQGVMEQELQMPSCLFGGPPVRDDIVKLGESQIGFMNIFARPLFEAVADILPAMRFAVDEILTNKSIWDKKIDDERQRKRKSPNLVLGHLAPSFAVDPTPSPFSGGPSKSNANASQPLDVHSVNRVMPPNESGRRGSSGSVQGPVPHSRRSSLGIEKSSRRSSVPEMSEQWPLVSQENQSSRRGSRDASLTAILVTQSPPSPNTHSHTKDTTIHADERLRGDRKDTLTRSSSKKKDQESNRPLTAPSQAKSKQVLNLYPMPQSSTQSQSEVDLSQSTNGNYDGSKVQSWDSSKISGDSHASRSDVSRDSSWWRQMSSRRRTRDIRNGDAEGMNYNKESALDTLPSNTDSTTTSPTHHSPGRQSKAGKIMNFFKRKPKSQEGYEKQLSSFGSSSQLRSPPTSDPGRSLNSDD